MCIQFKGFVEAFKLTIHQKLDLNIDSGLVRVYLMKLSKKKTKLLFKIFNYLFYFQSGWRLIGGIILCYSLTNIIKFNEGFSKTVKNFKTLELIDNKYKKTSSVSMSLLKKVNYALLAKTKLFNGNLVIAGNRLRLEIIPPDKSLLIYDSTNLWLINYITNDSKEDVQVTKVSNKNKKEKEWGWTLLSLLGQGGIQKYFIPVKEIKENHFVSYFLKPQQFSPDFKEIKVTINSDKLIITEIIYWDDLGNETSFHFDKVVFDKKISNNFFDYSPPKGTAVTIY